MALPSRQANARIMPENLEGGKALEGVSLPHPPPPGIPGARHGEQNEHSGGASSMAATTPTRPVGAGSLSRSVKGCAAQGVAMGQQGPNSIVRRMRRGFQGDALDAG